MLQWLGCARQGQTRISPGQGTREYAAPALSCVSWLMVAPCHGYATGFLLVLLQHRMSSNKNHMQFHFSYPAAFSFSMQPCTQLLVWTALMSKRTSSASSSATMQRAVLLGSVPTRLFWLVLEPLSWARGAERKTQPCKESPGSLFRP